MIGIDVTSIERIQKLIDRFGEKGLKRFLSKDEMELVNSARTAAGFWASKEAISKALGCGIGEKLSFHDITISKTDLNAPVASLSKDAMLLHGVKNIAISITHDSGLAIAVAFVEKSS